MRKKITTILIILLVIGLTSCGKKEETASEKKPPVKEAKIETLTLSTVEDLYEAVGTIRSKTTSVLSSRTVGNILAIHVREGDYVKPGQLLVEIDDRDAGIQLRKTQAAGQEAQEMLAEVEQTIQAAESSRVAAEAHKTVATSTYNRYKILLERQSVSLQEFEEVQARYQARTAEADRAKEFLQSLNAKKEQVLAKIEQMKADVANANLSKEYCRIHSPIQGVVTGKMAEVGVLAAPGVPLLTVEDDIHYRLEASVDEVQLGKIHSGDPVRVIIDALGNTEWVGRVVEVGPTADPASRSAIVKIDLSQKTGGKGSRQNLRSGLFGKARFPAGQKQTIMIPQKAIIQRGQLQEVYIVDPSNIAHLRLIKTGKTYGDRVEVLAGIRDGERIIVEGVEKVNDGNRIQEEG